MKIIALEKEPIENYPHWIIPTFGKDNQGNKVIKEVNLPIFLGEISGLSKDISALIVTSDLQGVVKDGDTEHLLGEKLPEFLATFIDIELPLIDKNKIGVVLCGDLYANLNRRGGLGDVKNVWRTFKQHFKWVVGVAGNHDDFGSLNEFTAFKKEQHIHYLHKETKEIDSIKFGGISGIIGRTDKPQRVEHKDYVATLEKLLMQQPDALLLHQSPYISTNKNEKSDIIGQIIEHSPRNLIFCGHSHWKNPLVTLENDTQILNLDGRVVILVNSEK
jgi:3',5'-cyclic-AMP phosphodiesterase